MAETEKMEDLKACEMALWNLCEALAAGRYMCRPPDLMSFLKELDRNR